MQKLSVVIITFNEERNIERCLKSVQDIADEIVVVDSNSQDKTLEICEKYKAKVYQQEWLGYSEQKNLGNEKANYDYVFSIDADEALSEELKTSIQTAKNNNFGDAYQFNRLNNYCGKWIRHTSWYPDVKLRIWNKKQGLWKGEIHEKIYLSDNVKQIHLKGDLLHYSYYTIQDHIAQVNKFSEISADAKFNKGKKAGVFVIVFSPMFKFFKEYILKLGILDGLYGFAISVISAHESFLKYLKLYQKTHS